MKKGGLDMSKKKGHELDKWDVVLSFAVVISLIIGIIVMAISF